MDTIYNEYYDKLYNWSLKKTHNREDAEDLTNSIFVAIFEYFHKGISIAKIDNLIWKIAYNLWCTKAKSYIKEKNNIYLNEQYEIHEEVPLLDKVIYKEIIDSIDKCNLTKKEKLVFTLYYIDDLSLKEISQKINTKENNIKYFLYSARQKIKECYYE